MTTASTFVDSHIVGARLSGHGRGRADDAGRPAGSTTGSTTASRSARAETSSPGVSRGSRPSPTGGNGSSTSARRSSTAKPRTGPSRRRAFPRSTRPRTSSTRAPSRANHSFSYGGELAAVRGPVTLSGELSSTRVSSPQTNNPHFLGWYVMASWCLTGESRPYDRTLGVFGAIAPAQPFSFRHGGRGAWEVAARYSSMDLTSGTVPGGRFSRLSGALSWYPTRQWRLEFNYGYGTLDRYGLTRPHELLPAPPAVPALSAPARAGRECLGRGSVARPGSRL